MGPACTALRVRTLRTGGSALRKLVIVLVWGVVALGCAPTVCSMGRPIAVPTSLLRRKSEDAIRKQLLRETPIGTSIDQVRLYADMRGWRDPNHDENRGFLKQDHWPDGRPRNTDIGEKSVRGDLGDYGLIFRTNVAVYWGFNADGKLIEIWVWKTTDAL